jgi:hypothetical protein
MYLETSSETPALDSTVVAQDGATPTTGLHAKAASVLVYFKTYRENPYFGPGDLSLLTVDPPLIMGIPCMLTYAELYLFLLRKLRRFFKQSDADLPLFRVYRMDRYAQVIRRDFEEDDRFVFIDGDYICIVLDAPDLASGVFAQEQGTRHVLEEDRCRKCVSAVVCLLGLKRYNRAALLRNVR